MLGKKELEASLRHQRAGNGVDGCCCSKAGDMRVRAWQEVGHEQELPGQWSRQMYGCCSDGPKVQGTHRMLLWLVRRSAQRTAGELWSDPASLEPQAIFLSHVENR